MSFCLRKSSRHLVAAGASFNAMPGTCGSAVRLLDEDPLRQLTMHLCQVPDLFVFPPRQGRRRLQRRNLHLQHEDARNMRPPRGGCDVALTLA